MPSHGKICLSKPGRSHKLKPVTSATHNPPAANHWITWIIRAIVYLYALTFFAYNTADPDLWGHIKFGGDILAAGGIPPTESFSYTAFGNAWINHEWLTEVLFFLIYDLTDSTGLLLFKSLLGLLIVHLLSAHYFARSANHTVYLAIFLLVIPVMAPGFMTRPHLMTFLFLTVLVLILQKFADGNHRIILWTPLVFLLWANSHGGVVAGLGIFGLVAGVEAIRCFYSGETKGKLLIQYFALSCVAVFINPYGYKLWEFFYHSLGQARAITEWGPVPLADLSFLPLKILVLLFVITFALPTRKRIWEILIITVAIVYGFKHQRHTVLTVILMTPYLTLQFAQWAKGWDVKTLYDRLSGHFQTVTNIVLGIFLVVQAMFLLNKYGVHDYRVVITPTMYPTYAAQFMTANHLNGNILVPFDWGEYIIWKFPASKVSIDGRFRTAYPENIIAMNLAFSQGQLAGLILLTDFPTDLVLAKKGEAPFTAMEKRPGWVKVHQDAISKIFVRDTQPPSALMQNLITAGFVRSPDPPPYDFPG